MGARCGAGVTIQGTVRRRWCRALPAALLLPLGTRLDRSLVGVLALLEARLEQRHEQHEQREEGDQQEAEVRDDLVRRLAPPALTVVALRQGRGRQEQEGEERERESGEQ